MIPAQNLVEDFASYDIDLNAAFADVETVDANLLFSVSGNSNINVSIAGGIATISTTANWNGSETLTFTATDEGTSSVDQVVIFTVAAVNDDPTVANPIADVTVAEDAVPTVIDLSAVFADVDIATNSDSLTYSVVSSDGTLVTAAISGTDLTLTYLADQNGSATVTVTATDTNGSATVSDPFTVTVTPANDPPIITSDGSGPNANISVAENTTLVTTVTATDVDGDTLNYSITGGVDAAHFSIDNVTGELSFVAPPNYENSADQNGDNIYAVTIRASDGNGGFDNQSLSITVTDVNEFPISAISDTDAAANTVNENAISGTTVGVRASATDPDSGDTVSYSLDDNAGGLFTIDNNTGIVTVAGALDAETATSHSITIRATSSDASFSTLSLSISVTDMNEFNVGPVTDSNGIANAVAEDANIGTTVGISALATDADVTDNIVYSLSDNAAGRFAIDTNTGIITVNGALDYELNSSHSVTVLATSSDGSTSQQIFTTNVTDVSEDIPVDDTPTTDPPIEDSDPIDEITPDDPTSEPDDPTEDPFLDEGPQDFEEIMIIPDLTETDELIALGEDPAVELTEDIQDSVEGLRLEGSQKRPENDSSYRYFDNNLYKEVISAQHLDYQYQASENVLELDEFDDFGTIDFESNNFDEVITRGDYDLLRQEIDEAFNKQFKSEAVKTKIVTATAATFTIGIISYLLRAGSLAAALASSLPLWRGFDPIIVFSDKKKKDKDQDELPDTEELNADSFFEDDAE